MAQFVYLVIRIVLFLVKRTYYSFGLVDWFVRQCPVSRTLY